MTQTAIPSLTPLENSTSGTSKTGSRRPKCPAGCPTLRDFRRVGTMDLNPLQTLARRKAAVVSSLLG